jgi:aconitate hydratase
VLTNCHNSLCAVGGTINEDDHKFALSACHKYGGIYVPPNLANIHSYNREMMAGCGRMILGSDSHTRYGALGTLGVGEGGGELAKQLLGRTYDFTRPPVVAVYLTGAPRPGVGPHDVALALVGAVYRSGYVKNKVMEFVGPGIASLPIEYRNAVDVMTTETTCWSSIWETDGETKRYFALHGRPGDFRELHPAPVAYYDGCVAVDLSAVECSIAMPMHPSNVYTIHELQANAADILHQVEEAANRQIKGARMDLLSKLRPDGIYVEQGEITGCSGGTYDNICAAADILRGRSCGNGAFALSIYPGSMPAYLELVRSGRTADLVAAGAIMRECFCGPCFGAGDVPRQRRAFSIRHATRNFPNREGSKPGDGQVSAMWHLWTPAALRPPPVNGGRTHFRHRAGPPELLPEDLAREPYHYDDSAYEKPGSTTAVGRPQARDRAEVFGPNIKPTGPSSCHCPERGYCSPRSAPPSTDAVTTTDELIPSGETSSPTAPIPERLS